MRNNTIKAIGVILSLDINKIQTSPKDRPFRLSGIELVGTAPAQYINKMYQHDTIYTFRYLDAYSEFFSLYFYANGNFKEIIVNL